jgi:hypothetical protein
MNAATVKAGTIAMTVVAVGADAVVNMVTVVTAIVTNVKRSLLAPFF